MTLTLAYLHGDTVAGLFCESLTNVVARGMAHHLLARHSGVNVSHGRNELVRSFLEGDDDWLLMLDDDMVFTPQNVADLVGSAMQVGPCVMSGLYFGHENGVLHPHIYVIKDGEFGRVESWPDNSVFPIAATGAGFLLMHRQVLQDIERAGHSQAWPWFQETEIAGQRVGEDITFCFRAAEAGYPILMHTGVILGHYKSWVIDASRYDNPWAGRTIDDLMAEQAAV